MNAQCCVPHVTRFALAAAVTLGAALAHAQFVPPPIPEGTNSKAASIKAGVGLSLPASS